MQNTEMRFKIMEFEIKVFNAGYTAIRLIFTQFRKVLNVFKAK